MGWTLGRYFFFRYVTITFWFFVGIFALFSRWGSCVTTFVSSVSLFPYLYPFQMREAKL